MSSDNTDKNGLTSYTAINKLQEQAALWEDITEKEMDSPYDLWNDCYKAIASANLALQAIEEMGTPSSLLPQKGAALMCRAYAQWLHTKIFCLNFLPTTAAAQ